MMPHSTTESYPEEGDSYLQEEQDDDYEAVRISITWGMLSIAVFALVLMIQMFDGSFFGLNFLQAVAATLPLSLLGFVLGLIGIRYGRGKKAARFGVFLNGVVLCILLLLPLTYFILRHLR